MDVGGLSVDAARARLVAHAVAPRRRTLIVHAGGRTFVLAPAQTKLSADLDVALERARADSRQGWIGQRVAHDVSGRHLDESLPLKLHYAPGVVPQLVDRVAAAVRRAPRDASVTPSAGGLTLTPSHTGRELNAPALKRTLAAALVFPSHPANIPVTTKPSRRRCPAPSSRRSRRPTSSWTATTTSCASTSTSSSRTATRSQSAGRASRRRRASTTSSGSRRTVVVRAQLGLGGQARRQDHPAWPRRPDQGPLDGLQRGRRHPRHRSQRVQLDRPRRLARLRADVDPDVISLYARTPVGTPVYVA